MAQATCTEGSELLQGSSCKREKLIQHHRSWLSNSLRASFHKVKCYTNTRQLGSLTALSCFPKNKTGSYINFCSKNAVGLIFRGFFPHVHQSTFIQILSCHLLLVAAQWWRAGFHFTEAYFWGRAYIMSVLKNHTRAYFQVRSYFRGNGLLVTTEAEQVWN